MSTYRDKTDLRLAQWLETVDIQPDDLSMLRDICQLYYEAGKIDGMTRAEEIADKVLGVK